MLKSTVHPTHPRLSAWIPQRPGILDENQVWKVAKIMTVNSVLDMERLEMPLGYQGVRCVWGLGGLWARETFLSRFICYKGHDEIEELTLNS